jgi:DNA-binding IclR family transcriptional regulator
MLGTLKRAGDVLDLFTTDDPEWGVTAVARRLDIGKSLAHDVLASLAAIGLLQRVGSGRYRLGWRTVSLASVLLRTSELKLQARPVVREVAERKGLTVSLVAWDRRRLVYLDRCHSMRRVSVNGPVAGATVPIDGSAASKVLLASRCPDEVRSLWSCGFVHTRHASLDELELDLDAVRRNGWAHDEAGDAIPRNAVAAPVRDVGGDVAAALSLDPADRCAAADVHLHARMAVATASRISAAMRRCDAVNCN